MKLASLRTPDGRTTVGLLIEKAGTAGFVDIGRRVEAGSGMRALLSLPDWQARCTAASGGEIDYGLGDVTFLPVVPDPEKIICVGINYASHVKETGREMPEKPMIFARFASSQVGHMQPMIRPRISERFDFEGELAVVIGREARYVAPGDALGHVAGYSCYNDGSIRDWQRHSTQFTPGKNFPATGAFGPWMASADAVGDVRELSLTTRVNGEATQQATLDDLIFDIPTLISYCSQFTPLRPGDVIITGTTGGVGAFREPPLWLRPGDEVTVEISRIGMLRNPVAAEAA